MEVPVATELSTTLKEKIRYVCLDTSQLKEKFLTGVALRVACFPWVTSVGDIYTGTSRRGNGAVSGWSLSELVAVKDFFHTADLEDQMTFW